MKMLRLPRSKVQLGAPLPWNVRDESGRLLLSKGHVVETEGLLTALLERGAFVDVEEIKAASHQVVESARNHAHPREPNLISLWRHSGHDLKQVLAVLRQEDFARTLDRFVDYLVGLMDQHVDIAIYQCVRQEPLHLFHYGYNHAVHTAVLCQLMARHLEWPESRQRSLVKAALTMNLSIMELQGQMAGQDGPVVERQRVAIRAHPQQAVDLLQKAGIDDPEWLGAIAHHHDRPEDAAGGSHTLPEMAVALRVADVFLAKISPRHVRSPLSPQEAARQLFQEDHGGPLSTAVIKVFGIYPPGDVVHLASGEWGVVVQRTQNAKAPIVAAITDTSGKPVAHTERRDSSQPAYAIVGTARDNHLVAKLPAERLYGYAIPPESLIEQLLTLREVARDPVI